MMIVEELHDMESAAVHIEVDIPFLKIRRNSFPDSYFRVQLFHCAPRGIADVLK